jgi:shikimate kinase
VRSRKSEVWSSADRWYPAGVKRVLVTGMSGTGKSTVIASLAARGYKAIDADDGEWSEWVNVAGDDGPSSSSDPNWVWRTKDWVWREDRMQRLLTTEDAGVLFVGGCAPNQGKFYAQFDHIVLLSAPAAVLVERLATRTTNSYGKHPDELARVLGHLQTVEPRLRRVASLEVDTSAPLEQVVETILRGATEQSRSHSRAP